jgi:hypothetical protein
MRLARVVGGGSAAGAGDDLPPALAVASLLGSAAAASAVDGRRRSGERQPPLGPRVTPARQPGDGGGEISRIKLRCTRTDGGSMPAAAAGAAAHSAGAKEGLKQN